MSANADAGGGSRRAGMGQPVFRIFSELVPPALHQAAWVACERPCWAFGHQSNEAKTLPFWKMDLDGVEAISAVWRDAQPRCEAIAACALKVVRQYANGHTFGQGGRPHFDDSRAGTYTLLYYPVPEWRPEWEGETVFYHRNGEIAKAVLPAPNRAVFFDSRLPHAGRPPSRFVGGLRVTLAFKLEAAGSAVPASSTRAG